MSPRYDIAAGLVVALFGALQIAFDDDPAVIAYAVVPVGLALAVRGGLRARRHGLSGRSTASLAGMPETNFEDPRRSQGPWELVERPAWSLVLGLIFVGAGTALMLAIWEVSVAAIGAITLGVALLAAATVGFARRRRSRRI